MIQAMLQFAMRNMKHVPYFFHALRSGVLPLHYSNYALMGRLSASILHDILTPITSLSLGTSLAGRDRDGALEPAVERSARQIREFVDIMREFLSSAQEVRIIDVNAEIRKALRLISYKATEHGVQVQFVELDQIRSRAHPLHVYQIVINLLSNAIDASAASETRKVILVIRREKGNYVLDCRDFGSGMDETTLRLALAPRFTTKKDGCGLGLYSVRQVVSGQLGGKLDFRSEPGAGSLFSCRLPVRK